MPRKPKSACLKERPTTTIDNILQTVEGGWELCTQLRKDSRPPESWKDMTLEQYLVFHLGEEDFQWVGEFRHLVWDRPLYRLFVNNQKGLSLEVPEGATLEQALDALEQFRKDHGLSQSKLSGSEQWAAKELGRKAVGDRRFEVGRTPDEELKKFVLGYCDGRIFTDHDVRNSDDVGMVFLVLALGGLSMKDEVRDAIIKDGAPDSPGQKPEKSKKPTPEEKLKKPPKPERPERIKADPERLVKLERDGFWGLAPRDAVERYKEEISAQNWAQEQQYGKELVAWHGECVAIQLQQEAQDAEYAEQVKQWETETAHLDENIAAWELAEERYKIVWGVVSQLYYENLGCIWESIDQAGPRTINGMPIFFSCHIMHAEDWKRAKVAISKEIERRKDFSL
jgi:hypothetical protein